MRLRLTLVYGGLFLLSGAALLAITYLLVSRSLPAGPVMGRAAAPPGGLSGGEVFVQARAGNCGFLAGPLGTPAQVADRVQQCLSQQRALELKQLLTESGIALAIMTVVSIGLGWLIAGRVLRKLSTITAAARSVSASSLHARLALDGPDDELKELGDTFDGLLARLEAAFGAQRQHARSPGAPRGQPGRHRMTRRPRVARGGAGCVRGARLRHGRPCQTGYDHGLEA